MAHRRRADPETDRSAASRAATSCRCRSRASSVPDSPRRPAAITMLSESIRSLILRKRRARTAGSLKASIWRATSPSSATTARSCPRFGAGPLPRLRRVLLQRRVEPAGVHHSGARRSTRPQHGSRTVAREGGARHCETPRLPIVRLEVAKQNEAAYAMYTYDGISCR